VNGLVDAVALALSVGRRGERSAGQEAEGARDDGGLVGDDVAEQVARDDNAVEGTRVLDHQHGGRVDQVVAELQLRELLLHDLSHNLAPQTAGRHHVGLVERPHRRGRVLSQSEVGSEASDALNFVAVVGLRVAGVAAAVVLCALAEVDAAGQLADNVEVDAAADLGLEGRAVDEGLGGEEARAKVSVGAHFFAQLEDALFRADLAGAPFGTANGSEEDGVGGLCSFESLVGQGLSGGIDGGLSTLVDGLGLGELGQKYATEEMVLEVELEVGVLLDGAKDLKSAVRECW
jgi:hypothetical protein